MSDEMGYTLLVLIPILSLIPITFWVHRREDRQRDEEHQHYMELAKRDLEQLKALRAKLTP